MTERKYIVYTILVFMLFALISASLFGIASFMDNKAPEKYTNEDVNISNTSTYSDIASNYKEIQFFYDFYAASSPEEYEFIKTVRFYNNNAQIYCDVDLTFQKTSNGIYYARFFANNAWDSNIDTSKFYFYSGDVNYTDSVTFTKMSDSGIYWIKFDMTQFSKTEVLILKTRQLRIRDDNSYPTFDCKVYNYVGGTWIRTLTCYNVHGVIIYPELNEFPTISRTGYSFLGWYIGDSRTNQYNPRTCNKTSQFNVYGEWSLNQYPIIEHIIIKSTTGDKTYSTSSLVSTKGNYNYGSTVNLSYSSLYMSASSFSTYIAQQQIHDLNAEDYQVLSFKGAFYNEAGTDPVGETTTIEASPKHIYIIYEVDPETISGFKYTYQNIQTSPHYEYYRYQHDYIVDLENNGVLTVEEGTQAYYKEMLFYNPLFKKYSLELVKFYRLDGISIKNGTATSAYVSLINYTGYNSDGAWAGPTIQYSNDLLSCSNVPSVTSEGVTNLEIAGITTLFNTSSSNYFVTAEDGTQEVCVLIFIDAYYFDDYVFALCDNSEPIATYHLTYELNGGLFDQPVNNTAFLTDAGIVIDYNIHKASREHYTLDGIYLDAAFTKPLELIATEYPASSEVKLYFDWNRNQVSVSYKVVGDPSLNTWSYGYVNGEIQKVNNNYTYITSLHDEATVFNPAVNFTLAFRRDRSNANRWATAATFGLCDVFTLYEYRFLGWSTTYSDYTTWDTLTKDYKGTILTAEDYIYSNTTLYAVFYLEDKDTCCEYWAWDNSINFKAIEADEELPTRMINELTDRSEDEAGLYYVVIYDYNGKKDDSVILASSKHTIGDSVELWNTDEALVNIQALLLRFNYKIIGWSTTPTDVKLWDTLTHKSDLDNANISLVDDPYEIKTTQTLYAVCCLETVYSDVIKDYEIWNEEEGLTIDNDIKDAAETIKDKASETWENVKDTASNLWDTVKNFTTNKWDEIWKYLKWILVGVGAILVLVVVVKIINAIK